MTGINYTPSTNGRGCDLGGFFVYIFGDASITGRPFNIVNRLDKLG